MADKKKTAKAKPAGKPKSSAKPAAPVKKPTPAKKPAPVKKPARMKKPAPAPKPSTSQKPPASKKTVPLKKPAAAKMPAVAVKPAPTKKPAAKSDAKGKDRAGSPLPPPPQNFAPAKKPQTKVLQVGELKGQAALKALTSRSSSLALDNRKFFTAAELKMYHQLLLNVRDRIVDEIGFLVGDNLNRSARDAAGDLSHYSLHMADQGTDNFDRDFALNLASSEQDLLHEIDEALHRIADHSYGMCEITGQPIEKDRLKALPHARYCIAAQTELEKGRTKYRPFGPSMMMGS